MAPASKEETLYSDPEDGAFDLSGWLATRTGVLPVEPIRTRGGWLR